MSSLGGIRGYSSNLQQWPSGTTDVRTVFVLFDSLNRLSLGPYGSASVKTPNFDRLAKRTITFDKHYVGSLPCIPARRDLQTGRINFLHRSWGPIEPFDDAFPEILAANSVYSHLVTDHLQYFRDGGATYHTRYHTFEHVRGQHGDAWKAIVAPDWRRLEREYHPIQFDTERGSDHYHNMLNREFIREEKDYPLTKCFDAGIEFLDYNRAADNWFLQIETFDPHEPFTTPERFREGMTSAYQGPILDWPPYARVQETPEECAELNVNYRANIAFCDDQLGRLLDYFDAHDLWEDTALVVSTDHGYLLGEHDWWAKNRMPCYEEIVHIPLFVHHPDHAAEAGTRRSSLTQTMDLMPTFLDFHGAEIPEDVIAKSLLPVLRNDAPVRHAALFGLFGGAANVTDGRYTLFLYPEEVTAQGLYQYTLMPTTLDTRFTPDELARAELAEPFRFSKGARLLRIPVLETSPFNPYFGPPVFHDTETVLFDLDSDPRQEAPFRNAGIEARLSKEIRMLMQELDAPPEMYDRLGLTRPSCAS